MKFNEFRNQVEDIKKRNRNCYGNYGIDYEIIWGGKDNSVVLDAEVSWPNLESSRLDDALWFAQALESACFEGAKLVGLEVEG